MICDLSSGMTRLQRATKALRDQWSETRLHWNDQTAMEFEKKHLESIVPHLRLLASELNELRDLYDKAEKDCRDDMTQA